MCTIKSPREIDRIFREAERSAHPLLVALATATPDGRGPCGRVVVVAGKRLGIAVLRNRSKRVLREAVRRAGGPWRGFDVVLVAKTPVATATPADIDMALRSVLRKLGVLS